MCISVFIQTFFELQVFAICFPFQDETSFSNSSDESVEKRQQVMVFLEKHDDRIAENVVGFVEAKHVVFG